MLRLSEKNLGKNRRKEIYDFLRKKCQAFLCGAAAKQQVASSKKQLGMSGQPHHEANMVKSITGLTNAKRFGARYGRRIKELFETAEKSARSLHKCPYCHAIKVKRMSVGIWSCRKCCTTFTGKAYIPYGPSKTTLVEANEE